MKIFALLFLFLLSSCGNYLTSDEVMQSWAGKNIDEVIKVWGIPDDEKHIAGKKYFYWESRDTLTEAGSLDNYGSIYNYGGANLNYNQTTFVNPSITREMICKKYFEVDKNNIVISWNVKGNGCSRYEHINLVNPNYLNAKQQPK